MGINGCRIARIVIKFKYENIIVFEKFEVINEHGQLKGK